MSFLFETPVLKDGTHLTIVLKAQGLNKLILVQRARIPWQIVVTYFAKPNIDTPFTAVIDVVASNVLSDAGTIPMLQSTDSRSIQHLIANSIVRDVLLVGELIEDRVCRTVTMTGSVLFEVINDALRRIKHRIVTHIGTFDVVVHLCQDFVNIAFDGRRLIKQRILVQVLFGISIQT